MKDQISIEGRSKVLNVAFVIVNIIGLVFLVMGNHASFEESAGLFNTIGLILMIISIGGLILFKGRVMMSSFSRVVVGGLFIVSGLVKANDPIGFSYKLEEYFEDGALAFRIKEWFNSPEFSMEFFMDYALLLSVLICIAEIVLGVLTIIGGKIKLVSYLMLFMMVFFTFLTWHTSSCDANARFTDRDRYEMTDGVAQIKINEAPNDPAITIVSQTDKEVVVDELKQPQCVADCGCFGDALKGSVGRSLTPSESLWKDIILLYLVVWIFVAQRKIRPNTGKENLIYTGLSMLVIVFFSWVFGWYFPIGFGLVAILGALWTLRAGGKWLGNHYGSILFVTFICSLLVIYVLAYVPVKDYRPYAIGSNLKEKMNDGIDAKYENVLVYENVKTGEQDVFPDESKEWDKRPDIFDSKKWKFVENRQKEVVKGKLNSINDFKPSIRVQDVSPLEKALLFVSDTLDAHKVKLMTVFSLEYESAYQIPFEEYEMYPEEYPEDKFNILDTLEVMDTLFQDIDAKDAIIDMDNVVLVISKRLEDGNWSRMNDIKKIAAECKEKDVPMIMICNASSDEIVAFRKKNKLNVPIFTMDEIELKIISRSNPAVLVLEKGVVKAKYGHRSFPAVDKFKSSYLNK
ncbi:MAG: DoxX family membrane protein [Crocinitomicaceae bacterium]|nr:DoxX family membrane protein [Crocinitomicaceae bacterium]